MLVWGLLQRKKFFCDIFFDISCHIQNFSYLCTRFGSEGYSRSEIRFFEKGKKMKIFRQLFGGLNFYTYLCSPKRKVLPM